MTFELRPYQEKFSLNLAKSVAQCKKVIACLPTGGGKCLGKNTPVLMYDGTFKMVQDIKKGDLIMSPDSKPKKILGTCTGFDNMYEIIPTKGIPFICNEPHILNLVSSGTDCGFEKDKYYNIPLNEYLSLNKTQKHILKIHRCKELSFEEKDVLIDPYFLGIWLGDGDSNFCTITTMDNEISLFIDHYCKLNNYKLLVREDKRGNKAKRYHISKNYSHSGPISLFKKYSLLKNKHIPHDYLTNSKDVRFNLLAGLIDTDGYLHHNGYEIFTSSFKLANDISFLARSLGFYSFVRKKNNVNGFKISITGEGLEYIPVKINYKKCTKREQIKDAQRTGFKIKSLGLGEYFGFDIGGDGLFLINHDLTVTHNTKVFISIARRAISKGKTVLIITETRKIFDQIQAEAQGIEIKASGAKVFGVMPGKIYVSMAQTLSRRPLLISQFYEMSDKLLVVNDEAHIGTGTKLLLQLPEALLIGFTATPDWNAGKHLSELYKGIVVGAQVHDLIQEGFLTPYIHFMRVGANIDALQLKNGEFTEESQQAAFETSAVYEGLIEDLKTIKYKKCLVFCSSIKACQDMICELEAAGFECVEYHSKCENNSYNLYKFMHGNISICVSCAALTKGFDFPKIDMIAIVRATTSLPLYFQMIGRGSRIMKGKDRFTVLDYGLNYRRFKRTWDADVEWEELWLPQKKQKKSETVGVSPVKECEVCGALIPASNVICPFCAAVIPVQEKEKEVGELVEITEGYTKMVGKRIGELNPEELALFARLKNKKAFSIRVARSQEQKTPGYLEQFAAAMNYKKSWLNHQNITEEPIEFYDIILK